MLLKRKSRAVAETTDLVFHCHFLFKVRGLVGLKNVMAGSDTTGAYLKQQHEVSDEDEEAGEEELDACLCSCSLAQNTLNLDSTHHQHSHQWEA